MINQTEELKEKCSRTTCRSCSYHGLLPILDLGSMPHSDGFLSKSQLSDTEPTYPLEAAFCPDCSLMQIIETVPPEALFNDEYIYFSSFSESLLKHSRKNALSLIEERHLDTDSFVLEIASNDGYMLRNFTEKGIPVLGIDPSEGPAKEAEAIGVPTMQEFFTVDLAKKFRNEDKRADVIIANNVLAHVADTNGFVEGIGLVLKDNGIAVIEVPYVKHLVEKTEFDTIYHQHLCYFSVTALDKLFRRHDLFLNRIIQLAIHGGSLRLFVGLKENVHESVKDLLQAEADEGLDRYPYYQNFSEKVIQLRDKLCKLLAELKSGGKTIAGYGAAAKGAIMLNYIGAGQETIDFVVDRNIHKQGKYIPGVRIPICDPARIIEQMPDYVLLLPWNLEKEILSQQTEYMNRGGRFIIPVPEPRIVQRL